jgi:D-sedoheptulose 7-phosphate isomerase
MSVDLERPDTIAPLRSPRTAFKAYRDRLTAVMDAFDWAPVEELAHELADCVATRRQVFLAGNGGSAGNAIHLANDFLYGIAKQPGHAMRVQALSANPAVITCLANDEGYDRIFEIQLAELAQPDDVLIVLSGSGNSPNILRALRQAKKMDVRSYAILGFTGGQAKTLADVAIHAPIEDMQIAEDMQVVIGHMIMQWLWETRATRASSVTPASRTWRPR